MEGIAGLFKKKQSLSTSLPLFSIMVVNLAGLKLILAQEMSFFRPWGIRLLLVTSEVFHKRSDGGQLIARLQQRADGDTRRTTFESSAHSTIYSAPILN